MLKVFNLKKAQLSKAIPPMITLRRKKRPQIKQRDRSKFTKTYQFLLKVLTS